MKVIRATLLAFSLLCIVLAFTMGSNAEPPPGDMEEFRKGEIIAEIRPGATIEAINERNRTVTIEQMYGTNFYRLRIPQGKSENKWIKRLEADADVLSASRNPVVISPSSVFARVTVGFPDGNPTPGGDRTTYLSQPDLFNHVTRLRGSSKGWWIPTEARVRKVGPCTI